MKHSNLISGLFLICVSFIFIKCSKSNREKEIEPLTQVKINIKDEAGNNVPNVAVSFYNVIPTETLFTDVNGDVLFNLEKVGIFAGWVAEKGCLSNRQDDFSNIIVKSHEFNSFNTVLHETGILKLIITTQSSYSIACNLFTGVLGGINTLHFYSYAGSLAFHSELVSTPSMGKDTIVQISCGDTTSIYLPY